MSTPVDSTNHEHDAPQGIPMSIGLMRSSTEGNPRPFAVFLAGDSHLLGPNPGVLDALAEGILKEAGENGKRTAERRSKLAQIFHEALMSAAAAAASALGSAPSPAETSALLAHELQAAMRGFITEQYGEAYKPPEPLPEDPDVVVIDASPPATDIMFT
jgi:hypothetical protein